MKKSHGGFEDILLRAQKNDQSHYMVNKGELNGPNFEKFTLGIIKLLLGWLYKAFLRNLHDNQRQKLIEPLRHRFEEKLKTQAYVCKKCGNGYRPVNKDSCYAHVGQPMMTHIENVSMTHTVIVSPKNSLIVFLGMDAIMLSTCVLFRPWKWSESFAQRPSPFGILPFEL